MPRRITLVMARPTGRQRAAAVAASLVPCPTCPSVRWAGHRLLWWHRRGLAMVRGPAVWADAVHRPSRELAPLVHLVADRADDGELREILLPRRVAHATR